MIYTNIVLEIRIVKYNLRAFTKDFVRMLVIISDDCKTINFKCRLPDSHCRQA